MPPSSHSVCAFSESSFISSSWTSSRPNCSFEISRHSLREWCPPQCIHVICLGFCKLGALVHHFARSFLFFVRWHGRHCLPHVGNLFRPTFSCCNCFSMRFVDSWNPPHLQKVSTLLFLHLVLVFIFFLCKVYTVVVLRCFFLSAPASVQGRLHSKIVELT